MSDEAMEENVAKHGWQAISVTDGPSPFLYTCGLMTTHDHPELLIFDEDADFCYSVLAAMADDIAKGKRFDEPGEFAGVLVEGNVAVRQIHPTQHEFYLGYAMAHCRLAGRIGDLKAMQVFWPDANGKFPFQRGCDDDVYHAQPRLDGELADSEIEERRNETP